MKKVKLLLLFSLSASYGAFANPIIVAKPDTVCKGSMVLLYVSGIAGATYLWSTGATTDSIIVYPAMTTKYVVNVKKGINSYKDSMSIIVDTMPVVTFTGTHVCHGSFLHLTAHGGTKYNWGNGDTTDSYPSIAPFSDKTFTVAVWNGVCSLIASGTIIVDTMPIIFIRGDTVVCTGHTTTIHVYDRNGGGDTYLWQGGSTTDSLVFANNNLRSKDTIFAFHVAVSKGACSIDTTVRIRVLPLPCSLGTEALSISIGLWSVYPNPTSDYITVKMELVQKQNIEFILYNTLGQIVYDENLSGQLGELNQEINLSPLPNGIYLLKVNSGNIYNTQKLIKQD